jgi:hypothetical protein
MTIGLKISNGKAPNGGAVGGCRLTEEDVYNIANLVKNGFPILEASKIFNVSRGAVDGIIYFKNWKHLNLKSCYQ